MFLTLPLPFFRSSFTPPPAVVLSIRAPPKLAVETCNLSPGLLVPMPTSPSEVIRSLSLPLMLQTNAELIASLLTSTSRIKFPPPEAPLIR